MKKKLGVMEIIWLAVGGLVGSGLVVNTGVAAGMTGYSVWLAFTVATVLGALSVIPYFIAAGTAVLDGGIYTTNALFGNQVLGGITVINVFPAVLGQAAMPIGLGMYIKVLFPGVSALAVGVVIVLFFYIMNLMGVNALAKVQKYMMYFLLAGLFVFVCFSFRNFDMETLNVRGTQFFTGGMAGFVAAVNIFSMSTQSYYGVLPFGKSAKNPKKTILMGMVLAFPIMILIDTIVPMAAVGATGLEGFAGKTLSDVAKIIMPTPVFLAFTILCPLMALATTLNGNMSSFSLMLTAASNDGWLPKFMGKKNKHGVSNFTVTLVAALILIPAILDLSVSFIYSNMALFINAASLCPFFAIWMMPKKFPELWKKSKVYMKPFWFHTVMGIGLIARIVLIYFSVKSLSLINLLINIAVGMVLVLFVVWRVKTNKVSVVPEYSDGEEEE